MWKTKDFIAKKLAEKTASEEVTTVTEDQLDGEKWIDSDVNQVTEGQLKNRRWDENNTTIEKTLERVRSGTAHSLTEKRLEKNDSTLYKHRNPDAHTGNMHKVEEQRLARDYVNEKEEYETASESSPKMRIEKIKPGKDGIKLASVQKTAQFEDVLDEVNEGWSDQALGVDDPHSLEFSIHDSEDAFDTEDPEDIEKALRDYKIIDEDVLLDDEIDAEIDSSAEPFELEEIEQDGEDKIGYVSIDATSPIFSDDLSQRVEEVVKYLRDIYNSEGYIVTPDNIMPEPGNPNKFGFMLTLSSPDDEDFVDDEDENDDEDEEF